MGGECGQSAAVQQPAAEADDVFDMPCLWRDEAVAALGLAGEEVMAAVSPGAAFPSVLRSIVAAVPATVGTIVDLGAGAGGASEWLRQQLGASVIAVEPASRAREVASRRFPLLDVRDGEADRTGLAAGSADVVVLCGVLSLMDDLGPVLDEVVRVLRRPGHLAIADLFPADTLDFEAGPNSFRSFEGLGRLIQQRGFTIVDIGCGPADPDPAWSAVATRVSAWIETNCADRRGFVEWHDDQAHLRRQIDEGQVLGGCVVARNVA
jgi:SAM-dependent methyltransferase